MYPDARSIIGKEIDDYRVDEILGYGGMGIVYKAENQALGRTVALKVIAPRLARDEAFIKRFRREARALAQLYHPNIVLVFALRQVDLGLYIAMEYVEGQTLAERLEVDRPVAMHQALPLIKQLLAALDYAHERGVIHRDLKPRNIMLNEAGEVKVMDFGLAKMLGEGSGDTTGSAMRAGTLCYMSPEQAKGLKNVDQRSDLFSLGLILYEMLSGRLPFNKDDSEFNILKAIVEEKLPSPHTFNPALTRSLSKIIMKALEKKPKKRYQSAGEMLAAIEAFERHQQAETLLEFPTSKTPPKPRRRWRYVLVAVVLLLLGFGGYFSLPALTSFSLFSERSVDSTTTRVLPQQVPTGKTGGDEDTGQTDTGTDQPDDTLAVVQSSTDEQTIEQQGEESLDPDSLTQEELTRDQREEVEDPEPLSQTGILDIRSDPPGASIFIDGQWSGTTPHTVQDVAVGRRTIVLRLDGHTDVTESVVVGAQQTRQIEAALDALTGVLQVGALPWGHLYVDGTLMREEVTAPIRIDLPARSHTVTVEHSTLGTWEREVVISPETPQIVAVDFTRLVVVRVYAEDTEGNLVRGEVFVDGEPRGSSPRAVQVRVGRRRIEVRADGYVIDGAAPRPNFEQDWTESLKIILRKETQ